MRSFKIPRSFAPALGLVLVLGLGGSVGLAKESPLERGAELFAKGEWIDAAHAFEEGENGDDLLTRKFNAGVSYLKAEDLDEGLRRFEDVASRAKGELARAAERNAAWCHFERGSKRFAAARATAVDDGAATPPAPAAPEPAEKDPLEAKLAALQEAAESFRLALDFYRRVDPPEDATERDIGVAKTALVAVLDEIAHVEEEIQRRQDELLLEDPPKMIATMIATEKLHRAIARGLGRGSTSERRIGARRLQRAQRENRERGELLAHYLREKADEAAAAEKSKASAGTGSAGTGSTSSAADLEARVGELATERQRALAAGGLSDEEREAAERELVLLEELRSRLPAMSEEERAELREKLDVFGKGANAEGDAAADAESLGRAADAVARALEAQRAAESRYAARDPGGAVEHHSVAIEELRTARTAFPLDPFELAAEATATQRGVLEATRAIEAERGGDASSSPASAASNPASTFGGRLLDALKDKYLRPLAKAFAPNRSEELGAIAEEEDDVIWTAALLANADIPPIPATPPGQMGLGSDLAGGATDPSAAAADEAEAKERAAKFKEEAGRARDDATTAREALARGDSEAAIPPEESALAALERILELRPKPPVPPEERLRELVEREREAREIARGLEELSGDPLTAASRELAGRERDDGKSAEEIATQFEAREKDPRMPEVTKKVREGGEAIYAAAESLDRELAREAGESIDRAVAALEKALELLRDEQSKDGKNDQGKKGNQGSSPEDGSNEGRSLSVRDARRQIEEMDQERRRQEAKLFLGSSGVTVDKDW